MTNYKITMDYVDEYGDNYHLTTYTNKASYGIENVMVDYFIQYYRTHSHEPTKDEESEARNYIKIEEIDNINDKDNDIYCSTDSNDTSVYVKDELYDIIYDIIYDYYDEGYPYVVNRYADGDPTYLFDMDIDESNLSYHIVLRGLNKDDIEGLIDDFLVPETKDLNAKYTYRCERTGKLRSTAYIDIEFS